MYMAGSYCSLVHLPLPTELVRLLRGRPAFFAGHASEKDGASQVMPVTMTLPLKFRVRA